MSDNAGAHVELRSLVKQYPGVPTAAVNGVDLTVEAGEFVTLLGPSGSGKTTTLNMIAGFVETTSGSITIDGRDMTQVPTYERNLGIVFQNYSLFPHMNVVANVAYPLRRRGVSRKESLAKAHEALRRVHLDGFAERRPSALSGGQQQRVALARALVYGPPLLLLDEPLGALDKGLRESMQQEISSLHRDLGLSFIFVTHDQEEALAMSDRIAVFREGQIVQVGSATELYDRPESLYIAQFLGDSNVLRGDVLAQGQYTELVCGDLKVAGRCAHRVATGEPMALVVRPERVVLGGTDQLRISGVVKDVTFLGSYRKLRLILQSGEVMVARVGAHEGAGLSVGDRLDIGWNPDDAVVVPSDQPVK